LPERWAHAIHGGVFPPCGWSEAVLEGTLQLIKALLLLVLWIAVEFDLCEPAVSTGLKVKVKRALRESKEPAPQLVMTVGDLLRGIVSEQLEKALFGKVPRHVDTRFVEGKCSSNVHGRAQPNETRISCSLWRPQPRKIASASRGRHGLAASCAG